MVGISSSLIVPELAQLYETLAPFSEALLRIAVGLALVPHGLRMTFGLFPDTGLPVRSLTMLADQLNRTGWRPGKLWAPLIALTELVCGPLLRTRSVHPFRRHPDRRISVGLQHRALAGWGIFLEYARSRIYADVDGRGVVLLATWRRRVLHRRVDAMAILNREGYATRLGRS
jgi:hypothetical protein